MWAFDDSSDELAVNQTAAQPCYLTNGEPRKDGKPCAKRQQPVFDGKFSFYNSGIIPYDGPAGNTYSVQLAEDIAPGSYWFYCNYHGEFQSTEVVVKPANQRVPSADDVNRAARDEVKKATDGFQAIVEDAQDGRVSMKGPNVPKMTVEGNFAGLFDPTFNHWHSINEFVPKRLSVEAGEDLTWNLFGFHTISFGVPKYFPIFTFGEDGTVVRNKRLDPNAGGARRFDPPEEERYDEERTEPFRFDGGAWDGEGFWSSGTIDASPYIEYKMQITRPGEYKFACLIHPPMVGTVEVT